MRLAHYLPLLAAGLALLAAPALGQVVWNTTSGDYGQKLNWSPNTAVPSAGDNIRFNTGGGAPYTVNVNGEFESANLESNDTDVTLSLLGNDYTVHNTVEVLDEGFGGKLTIVNGRMFSATTLIGDFDSGGGLFIRGSAEYQTGFLQTGPFGSATLAVGTAASPGTLTTNNARIESTATSVVGVGSRWFSDEELTVGRNSTGSLLVDDQAIVTSSAGTILLGEIAGQGFVTVSNLGRIEGFSGFDVGVGARGTVDILSGGSIEGDTLRVAVAAGSAGSTVTVSGASGPTPSTLSVAVLTVGEGSQGALTVSNGAVLNTGETNLGWSPGSLGTVEVNTGGQWFAGDIFVGVSGQGGLTLRAASTLAGANLVIAEQENSVGTANLAGAASFTGGVFVGPGGDGELTVSNSLQTGAASAIGGRLDGQTGTVTIESPGVWTMTGGPLVIHNYGELDVRAGSILNTVGAEMGVRMFGDAVAVETAAATVSGTWNSGGLLLVGATADALLVVNSGGLLFSQDTRVADVYDMDLVHVDAIVTLQGGSWNNTGTLHVGDGGSGSVNVFADSLLTTGVTTLGSTVTDGSLLSHGIVNVSGSNAVWNSNGLLQVGTLGIGQVLISNQGTVQASEVRISDGLASLGSIEIDGTGSLLSLSGTLVVGANGAGILSITNGGELQTAAGAAIGNHDGLFSTVELTGGEWSNTGQLVVGNQGLGRLTITSGTVQTGTLTAGVALDAVGEVEVSGELTVNGTLTLGALGEGHLSVDGVVDVAGALRVGQSGLGSVSVQSGGEVNSLGGILGSSAGARANVEVQGAGSHWNASGATLIVGDQGEAVVEVYEGGQWTTSDLRIANFQRGDVLLEEAVAASSSLEMAQIGAAQADLAVFYRTPQHLGYVFDEDNYAGPPAPSAHTVGSFATALAVGSSWSIAGEVTVAVEGLALLGVVGGSTLQTGEAVLAEEAGSFAHVLVQQSAWTIAGALEVGAGGEGHLTIDNGLVSATGGVTLGAGGTVNLSSGVLQGSIITIDAGATLQGHGVLVADSITGIVGAPTAAVEFDGNLTIGPTQTALVSSAGTATFNGTIHLNGGTLAASDGIIIGDTGVLTGVGLIAADIQADGLVSIGSSPGTLNVDGDYMQTDDAALLIELEGAANSEFDRLLATGDVQLDGDLQVVLLNGYEPQFSDVFTIITGDSISGAFDNAPGNLVSFAGGAFQVLYGANSVQLGNFTPVPVPEPGMGLLLALAGGALLARRRMRSRAG